MPVPPPTPNLSPALQWTVWGLLLLVIALIAGAFLKKQFRPDAAPLPPAFPVYSQLGDFALTNQLGGVTTLADLRGKVSVVDIIFSRCPGPCAEMTRRMSALQAALPAGAGVQLLSLTTDPEFDTPEVLRKYGERFGAQPGRWLFLTGTKAQIRDVAVNGLKLVLLDKKIPEQTSPNDLFIHSTIFVIVDRQGRVRATVESDQPGHQRQVLDAVNRLLTEK